MPELEKKLAELQAKLDAANKVGESIEELKAEIASLKKEIETKNATIDALDKSAQEQKSALDDIKESLEAKKSVSLMGRIAEACEELKNAITKANAEGKSKVTVEVKAEDPAAMGTGNVNPNLALGLQSDPAVHAAPLSPNAFIEALGVAQSTGNKLHWVEASRNNVVGYVAELAQNTNQSDYTFAEKTRKYGKLVTKVEISTEFADWFTVLKDWALNDAPRIVEAKFDSEIYNGTGADSTNEEQVYGIKTYATAWAALHNGDTHANLGDVIANAVQQIKKEGFVANVAFVTYAEELQLRSLKNANGDLLYNQYTGLLGQLRIFPTTRLADGELVVMDSSCYKPYAGGSYEFEAVRDADYDKWKVYFRKRVQGKFTTPGTKGMVYCASISTAIAALAASGSLAGGNTL